MIDQAIDHYWAGYLEAVKHATEVLDEVDRECGHRVGKLGRQTIFGSKSAILNLTHVPYNHGWEPEWSRSLYNARPN